MKNMFAKSVCAVALSIASFVGFASAPIAIWGSFNGLSGESPLEPSYSSVYNQIDGSIWRFNLGGGSVQDGVLCTGTGPAPYISFGETVSGTQNIIDVGREGHPFTVVMAIETPVSAPSTGNPPYVHIGNGITGVGMAYVDSTKVCGTWYNAAWNATQAARQETLTALGEQSSVTYLAFSSAIPSANSAVAVIDPKANEISWGIIEGLTGVGVNASQINFGNYLNCNADGLSYKLKGVAVIDGRPTIDELRTVMAFMGSSVMVIDSDMTINSDYNDTLGRIFIKEGVTVTVTDSSKITDKTEIYGKGTIVYQGFYPTYKKGLTSSLWSGTAKLHSISSISDLNLSEFGNVTSKVILGTIGTSSTDLYFKNTPMDIYSDVDVSGLVIFRNGYAETVVNFRGELTGNKELRFPDTSRSFGTLKFYGDVSKFTGIFNCPNRTVGNAKGKIVFLSENSTSATYDSVNTGIIIADNCVVPANAHYTEKVIVYGTIKKGTGDLVSLELKTGAVLDVSDGYLVVNGDITLPEDGLITVKIIDDESAEISENITLFECSNAKSLDLSRIVVSPKPYFRYIIKTIDNKVVCERASGFSVIVR